MLITGLGGVGLAVVWGIFYQLFILMSLTIDLGAYRRGECTLGTYGIYLIHIGFTWYTQYWFMMPRR